MSAPASPPTPPNAAPRAAAYVGFLLFLVGMGMVVYVFLQANALLAAPPPAVPTVAAGDPDAATKAGLALGADITGFLQRLLVLLVMCIVGSVFASQGVGMLFAAWNTKPDAAPPAP